MRVPDKLAEYSKTTVVLVLAIAYAYLCFSVFEYFLGPMPGSDQDDYQTVRYSE
jgi:hypothetical protein